MNFLRQHPQPLLISGRQAQTERETTLCASRGAENLVACPLLSGGHMVGTLPFSITSATSGPSARMTYGCLKRRQSRHDLSRKSTSRRRTTHRSGREGAPGPPRQPDRPRQPNQVHRGRHRRVTGQPPPEAATRRAGHGPQPVQGHQRHPRAPLRRHPLAPLRNGCGSFCPRGQRRPTRRRRVRFPPSSLRPPRPPPRRPGKSSTHSVCPSPSVVWSSPSERPLASLSLPTTATNQGSCSSTPTSPCTPRRKAARAGP